MDSTTRTAFHATVLHLYLPDAVYLLPAYAHLDETPKKYVAIAFWGSICFVLLAEKLVTQEHFHFIVYYVAIIFLAAYAGLIYIYKGGRRALAGFLALALVSMEQPSIQP